MTLHAAATCEVCRSFTADQREAHRDFLRMLRGVPATPGWLCVKCGRSYAPFVSDCMVCNAQVRP